MKMMKIDRSVHSVVLSLLVIGGCVDDPEGRDASADLEGDRAVATDALPRSGVIQLFNWPFNAIRDEVCDLGQMGFSHIHVSPPQLSNPSTAWWGRYQPTDFRTIDGPLGNAGDFEDMAATAEDCGVTIIADVVLNHMANLGLEGGDLYYPPGCDRNQALNSGGNSCLVAPSNFHNEECIFDYGNHCAVMYGRICGGGGDRGLPDLATGYCEPGGFLDIHSRNYDPHVFGVAKEYLLRLEALGAGGFRLDAAKHMHPAFVYDLLTDPQVVAGMEYVYGEIIADRVSDPTLEAYRHVPALDFMDFPLTRSLQNAFSFGGDLGQLESITGSDQALDGPSSVSFVTNHDVWGNESGLGYRFSNHQDELLAHIYVLGRGDGLAYVYSEFSDGPSQSYRGPGEDYVFFHRRDHLKDMMAFHTRLLGEPTLPKWKGTNHLAFARGQRGFVAINKSGNAWDIGGVDTGLPDGLYVDALGGGTYTASQGRISGSVPARWGLMLIPASECDNGDCSL